MDASNWITIGIFLAGQTVAFIMALMNASKDRDAKMAEVWKAFHERTREVDQNFSDVRGDFRALNAEAAIYWKRTATDAGTRLHRPHEEAKKMDALLDEYRDTIMTPERLEELKVRLRAKVLDMKPEEGEAPEDIPERQRDAALMLHAEDQREQADPTKTVLIEETQPKETP